MPSKRVKVLLRGSKIKTPKTRKGGILSKTIKRAGNKKQLKKRKSTAVQDLVLKKHHLNPIISPRKDNSWDGWQTFNPGVVMLNNKIHFLYRAIGGDGLSRLGYAASDDGYSINERLSEPVYEHNVKQRTFNVFSYFSGGSWGGGEDPRIVRVDNEDRIYMTYTACNGDLRVALTSIKIDDFINKRWLWKRPILLSPPGEVHKNWVIFPEKINGRYAILHSMNPEIKIEYLDSLDIDDDKHIKSYHGGKPRKQCWDKWIRGAGPVPIRTKYGWLVFYHAMDNDWGKYRVGAMLLDINDPTKIISRAKAPILEPSEHYENHGFKGGVVYASGAVVKEGTLMVYYGGADSYICLAHTDFDEFVDNLYRNKEPKLRSSILKK